jgi:hypothetical protein
MQRFKLIIEKDRGPCIVDIKSLRHKEKRKLIDMDALYQRKRSLGDVSDETDPQNKK